MEQGAGALVEAMGFDYIPRLCAEAQHEADAAAEIAARSRATELAARLTESMTDTTTLCFAYTSKFTV